MNKYKILCVDGGGSKAAISLSFLIEIEKKIGKKIMDTFDLFVGTSAGSIIVASLTSKDFNKKPLFDSSEAILDMFVNNIDKIFYKSWYHSIKTFNGFIGPKYEASSEYETLHKIFKESNIEQNLIITANTIDPEINYFEFDSTQNIRVVDAIMASSAAPTYFGVYPLNIGSKKIDFVDGGISANNPSFAGYAEAIKRGYTNDNILLVSVGTGYVGASDSNLCDNGGLLQWAIPISSNMMETVSDYSEYQMQKILSPESYYRLNIKIKSDKMDVTDISELNSMVSNVRMAISTDPILSTKFEELCSKL